MTRIEMPTERIDYLQLALPTAGPALVARWGTQWDPFTVAAWDGLETPPGWMLTERVLHLSPDGEWASTFDEKSGEVRVTRVGASGPASVLSRDGGAGNVWTAVAPGGVAVAWMEGAVTLVSALPGGEAVARVKSGWAFDLQFSPGGRWLTEKGERAFRVFDRDARYKAIARIPTPGYFLADVADGPTAVVTGADKGSVSVWDLAARSATATFQVEGTVSALAISADGQRVLTGDLEGGVTLWDAAGVRLRSYEWDVPTPIAAVFSREGARAAVGGTGGAIVVWDLDDWAAPRAAQ
ncbi:WD40 repeat domain-containing protein [Paludisphaera soli]|uniref:WD40 repeat domain-containing protein n=1 Tax=Paludisphaera soli TaxID=2712865 RepID=UPI0013EB81DF|nr:WD40 repeat domain-containing protein [Paludisphaera soli]